MHTVDSINILADSTYYYTCGFYTTYEYPGYPNTITENRFKQLRESISSILDPRTTEYSSNGSAKIRHISYGISREFTIEHIVTNSNKNFLIAFYRAKRRSSFPFYYVNNKTYHTCKFMGPPIVNIVSPDASLFKVTMRLFEV